VPGAARTVRVRGTVLEKAGVERVVAVKEAGVLEEAATVVVAMVVVAAMVVTAAAATAVEALEVAKEGMAIHSDSDTGRLRNNHERTGGAGVTELGRSEALGTRTPHGGRRRPTPVPRRRDKGRLGGGSLEEYSRNHLSRCSHDSGSACHGCAIGSGRERSDPSTCCGPHEPQKTLLPRRGPTAELSSLSFWAVAALAAAISSAA